jgi:hypothetical protein
MRQIHTGCTRHIRESEANFARNCRATRDVTIGPLCMLIFRGWSSAGSLCSGLWLAPVTSDLDRTNQTSESNMFDHCDRSQLTKFQPARGEACRRRQPPHTARLNRLRQTSGRNRAYRFDFTVILNAMLPPEMKNTWSLVFMNLLWLSDSGIINPPHLI